MLVLSICEVHHIGEHMLVSASEKEHGINHVPADFWPCPKQTNPIVERNQYHLSALKNLPPSGSDEAEVIAAQLEPIRGEPDSLESLSEKRLPSHRRDLAL